MAVNRENNPTSHVTDCQRIKLMMTQPKKIRSAGYAIWFPWKLSYLAFRHKVYPVMNPSKIAYKKKHELSPRSQFKPSTILGSKKSLRQMLKNLASPQKRSAQLMFFPVMTSTEELLRGHTHTQGAFRLGVPFSDHRHSPVLVLKAMVFVWNHFKKPPFFVLWRVKGIRSSPTCVQRPMVTLILVHPMPETSHWGWFVPPISGIGNGLWHLCFGLYHIISITAIWKS